MGTRRRKAPRTEESEHFTESDADLPRRLSPMDHAAMRDAMQEEEEIDDLAPLRNMAQVHVHDVFS